MCLPYLQAADIAAYKRQLDAAMAELAGERQGREQLKQEVRCDDAYQPCVRSAALYA
jgi:hypothetical protein